MLKPFLWRAADGKHSSHYQRVREKKERESERVREGASEGRREGGRNRQRERERASEGCVMDSES